MIEGEQPMDYLLDTHIHTISSGHAYSTLTENAAAARLAGMALIAITDHGPLTPGSAHELYFMNFKAVPAVVEGVEVLCGVELSILNARGELDLRDEVIRHLDLVIASFHGVCMAPIGADGHTEALVNAMKNPHVRVLGHLCDPTYPFHVEEVVRAARDTGTIIELNNNCLKPGSRRLDRAAALRMYRLCNELGVNVVAASDAHHHSAVGRLEHAKAMAQEAGIRQELILNTSPARFKDILSQGK